MFFLNVIFIVSALFSLVGAFGVLWTKNIIYACIFLLMSLLGVAGLYFTLNADFVAVTQIMVYVGGVVILTLFAIMLTGGKDFKSRGQKLFSLSPAMGDKKTLIIGVIMGLFSFVLLCSLIFGPEKDYVQSRSFSSSIEDIGKLLISDHVVAFEFSSVLLLGALIGTVVIARARK